MLLATGGISDKLLGVVNRDALTEHSFLEIAVRVLSWIALVYGGVGVVHALVLLIPFAAPHLRWPSTPGSQWAMLTQSRIVVGAATDALCAISGWALLRQRALGRVGFIAWALLTIISSVLLEALTVGWILHYRYTPPYSNMRDRHLGWSVFNTLVALIRAAALPVLYLAFMCNGRVREFVTSTRAGGFEVVQQKPTR